MKPFYYLTITFWLCQMSESDAETVGGHWNNWVVFVLTSKRPISLLRIHAGPGKLRKEKFFSATAS